MNFVLGQRWLSHADTELGLGIITAVDTRRVTVAFPASDEERTYAIDNAPLSRLSYRIGDRIRLRDDAELEVTAVNELRGILIYTGIDADGREQTVTEQQLSAQVQLTGPQQRLASGQCDTNAAFQLRLETLRHRHRLQQSPVTGLLGARTSLLPHQLYIADTVANRFAPRVLLADEVGLGKTIEAGLIIHRQLHSGRAARVLILVPGTLQHQWLVEMLRRFNLHFSLFDRERLAAHEADGDNPFDTEQLVLCSIDWMAQDAAAAQQALAAHWDLLVVDEAHHLHWSPLQSSPAYDCVERLAARSSGVILLTATPEQAGIDGHFARLRLLDPARYYDLDTFKRAESGYQALNTLVRKLLQVTGPVPAALLQELRAYYGAAAGDIAAEQGAAGVIRQLLDRHGTGRVMLRNTRSAVAGFPERRLQVYPLPTPALYGERAPLFPERGRDETQWLPEDPRVTWLEQLLKRLRPAKVLVICAHADTAVALEHHLHLRAGIRSAAFHEGLTLLERDRAAAWFAEPELGAQALVCSEIGSEGRNFQFAQHLVLFDLPLNPDLLEQRIGRLDRIGQGPLIDIHVPYLQGSAQEVLQRWYDAGLDLFRQSFSAGYALYERFADALQQQMQQPDEQLETLIAQTAQAAQETRRALQEGRDALLELNSCDNAVAARLIEAIGTEEQSEVLRAYLERLWNYFAVDTELHSGEALVVRPSDHMFCPFPALPDDGVTVTFARAQALSREDMEFMTWEHPMVQGAMDLIISTELGNASAASISIKGLKPGTLLLEAVYTVHCPAARALQLERFLPLTPLRILVDQSGKNLSTVLGHERLNGLCANIPRNSAPAILGQVRDPVNTMQEHAARFAQAELPALVQSARTALSAHLGAEIDRLQALRAINPAIRAEEIEFFERQRDACLAALSKTAVQLQALRVIIST